VGLLERGWGLSYDQVFGAMQTAASLKMYIKVGSRTINHLYCCDMGIFELAAHHPTQPK